MTKLFDLVGFAAELKAIDHDLEALGPKIIEKACQIIAKKAKATIGHTHDAWAALAPSTLAKKSANTPLLETGELRDSIQYVVSGNEGCVGSDSPIAVYQELGSSKIPPRSFLVSAAIASEDRIHRLVGA